MVVCDSVGDGSFDGAILGGGSIDCCSVDWDDELLSWVCVCVGMGTDANSCAAENSCRCIIGEVVDGEQCVGCMISIGLRLVDVVGVVLDDWWLTCWLCLLE